MDKLDIQVLQHWGANMKKAKINMLTQLDIEGERCPYCLELSAKGVSVDDCNGCPIYNYNKNGCGGTPYSNVRRHLNDEDAYKHTKEEFKFLTKVIKAKEEQNK